MSRYTAPALVVVQENTSALVCLLHIHARHQNHFKDVLHIRRGVSHADVQGSVDTVGHLPKVTICILPKPIIRHIDVWENTMQMETCLLA